MPVEKKNPVHKNRKLSFILKDKINVNFSNKAKIQIYYTYLSLSKILIIQSRFMFSIKRLGL